MSNTLSIPAHKQGPVETTSGQIQVHGPAADKLHGHSAPPGSAPLRCATGIHSDRGESAQGAGILEWLDIKLAPGANQTQRGALGKWSNAEPRGSWGGRRRCTRFRAPDAAP